jgi:hypothetical protein
MRTNLQRFCCFAVQIRHGKRFNQRFPYSKLSDMHAARLHNASINVHSIVGDGTTIVVSFPKDANAFEVVEEHCTEL